VIAQVRADPQVPALRSFTEGLLIDHDAVAAGLALPCSNGATEGVVNQLLKRQMYGRASLTCSENGHSSRDDQLSLRESCRALQVTRSASCAARGNSRPRRGADDGGGTACGPSHRKCPGLVEPW
jgi:hypothetical protein